MPQMRAVMSGTSVKLRARAGTPRRSAAARRCAAARPSTAPSRTRTCSAPSPSTRASQSTSRDRARHQLMARARRNARRPALKVRKTRTQLALGHAEVVSQALSASRVRRLHRAEAAVAAAVVARAERAAAGVGDRARGTACRGRPSRRRCRARLHSMQTLWAAIAGRRPLQEGAEHLEQLALVDRAAAQLEVDRARARRSASRSRAWRCSRGARRRRDMNSSTSAKLRSAWIPPAVAQAPIVTSRRGVRADLADPLGVVRRGDRALDEREVVGPVAPRRAPASRK